jgi:hypothetical protein
VPDRSLGEAGGGGEGGCESGDGREQREVVPHGARGRMGIARALRELPTSEGGPAEELASLVERGVAFHNGGESRPAAAWLEALAALVAAASGRGEFGEGRAASG